MDHVHMFVETPPHVSVSDYVRRAKGCPSRKIQQELEHIRARYWRQRSGAGATSLPPPAISPMTSSCVTSANISKSNGLQTIATILPASASWSFRRLFCGVARVQLTFIRLDCTALITLESSESMTGCRTCVTAALFVSAVFPRLGQTIGFSRGRVTRRPVWGQAPSNFSSASLI